MGYWMECGGRVHVGIGGTEVISNIKVGSYRLSRRMDEGMEDGARIVRIEFAASSVVHATIVLRSLLLRRMLVMNCFGMRIVESDIVSMTPAYFVFFSRIDPRR